jgi:molybdopterin molybdotransferase
VTRPKRTRLSPAEAAIAILEEIGVLAPEHVSLRAARGRVLAAAVDSPLDLPHWDNSAMDGYAVRSIDIDAAAPTRLTVIEDIPAGSFPERTLGSGECARIFTGAPLPHAADCVIRQEDTTRIDAHTVQIDNTRDVGRNVRRRGEDVRAGARILDAGTVLGPAQIGVLASVACTEPIVYRRPRVAVLGTGDEIADPAERDAILTGRKIASSNTYTMLAMAEAAGAEVLDLGIAPDDPDAIRTHLGDAAGADILVTSGGMSVGEHDHLRSLLQGGGAELLFWRLRMRPGAPVGFGRYHGVPWIGLPGNPVSTMVTFELFVRPAIRKLMGCQGLFRRTITVRVGERIVTHADLQHFLRVTLALEDDVLTARTTGPQGSGILSSMARAHALLIVPETRREIPAGESLEAIRLDEPAHVVAPPF